MRYRRFGGVFEHQTSKHTLKVTDILLLLMIDGKSINFIFIVKKEGVEKDIELIVKDKETGEWDTESYKKIRDLAKQMVENGVTARLNSAQVKFKSGPLCRNVIIKMF